MPGTISKMVKLGQFSFNTVIDGSEVRITKMEVTRDAVILYWRSHRWSSFSKTDPVPNWELNKLPGVGLIVSRLVAVNRMNLDEGDE